MAKETIQHLMGLPDNTPVVIPEEPLEIAVTKRDIKKAKPGDPSCCAYAEAIKRALNTDRVLFYLKVCYAYRPELNVIDKYVLLKNDADNIKRFDETSDAYSKVVRLSPMTQGRTPEAVKAREKRNNDRRTYLMSLGMEKEEAEEVLSRRSRVKRRKPRKINKPRNVMWRAPATGKYIMGLPPGN